MTLQPRARIALGAVLVLGAIGAYYMLALKPVQQQASSLSASIASQRAAIKTAQSAYVVGRAAQAALKADGPEWAALQRAVPAQSDIPALLRTLQQTADAVGVQMQSIVLSGASGTSAAASAPSAPSTGAGSAGGATAANPIPLQLTFSGGYAALDRLVRRLDQLVVVSARGVQATGPLLTISSVNLTRSRQLTVQLSATIYQLQPAAAATASTTGG